MSSGTVTCIPLRVVVDSGNHSAAVVAGKDSVGWNNVVEDTAVDSSFDCTLDASTAVDVVVDSIHHCSDHDIGAPDLLHYQHLVSHDLDQQHDYLSSPLV